MSQRRNTDEDLRALERALLASPSDYDLADRLVTVRARRGEATVADAVLVFARRLQGKAPTTLSLVRRVSDLLGRQVSLLEALRAIDELYERDLVDARGALVDQSRGDAHERVFFTHGDWVVTTRRGDFRERSGSIIGRTHGTDWISYHNGMFGFDRPEIVPARVRETLRRMIDRKLGERPEPDRDSYQFAHPVCAGCMSMHGTHMVVRHPGWYDCPNVAIVRARDTTVARLVDALRALEWRPIKIFSETTGEHIGWGVAQPAGVTQREGIMWYRGKDRSPETDRSLYRRWLIQMAKAMLTPEASAPVTAWQEVLDSDWRDLLGREAVERILGSWRS